MVEKQARRRENESDEAYDRRIRSQYVDSCRFLLPAATPIGLSACVIGGTVAAVLVFHGRPEWMAFGVLAGGLAQFGVQWACVHLSQRKSGLAMMPKKPKSIRLPRLGPST